MKISAKLRYLRIAPRKVRLVADLIRGKSVEEAQIILNFIQKRASTPLLKLLQSATANAKHNFQLKEDNLYISEIQVDEGPKLKRWRPRARGQAFEIQKKTSHINLVLDEIKKKHKKIKKKAKKPKEIPSKKEPPEKGKPSIKKEKLRPKLEIPKPETQKRTKKIFRRKAFG